MEPGERVHEEGQAGAGEMAQLLGALGAGTEDLSSVTSTPPGSSQSTPAPGDPVSQVSVLMCTHAQTHTETHIFKNKMDKF